MMIPLGGLAGATGAWWVGKRIARGLPRPVSPPLLTMQETLEYDLLRCNQACKNLAYCVDEDVDTGRRLCFNQCLRILAVPNPALVIQ